MITLATFRPEYFNQNGDQANLEVLGMQLLWRGVSCELTAEDYDSADLLLIGDASRAAMREFHDELQAFVPLLSERLANGLPTLLVGSAHEFFSGKVRNLPALTKGERVSEFREVQQSGHSAFGYRNSEFNEDLFVSGAFVSTSLFGPVLAKSPDLLELMLTRLGVQEVLPSEVAAELDELVKQVRSRAIAG